MTPPSEGTPLVWSPLRCCVTLLLLLLLLLSEEAAMACATCGPAHGWASQPLPPTAPLSASVPSPRPRRLCSATPPTVAVTTAAAAAPSQLGAWRGLAGVAFCTGALWGAAATGAAAAFTTAATGGSGGGGGAATGRAMGAAARVSGASGRFG